MDKKNSLRRSLSVTNISSPIAESTHLNKSYKFPWGGPTQKYSMANNASNKINSKLVENTTIKSTKMSPMNITKIDPRIYTDIHSKGLTSRIVKYHDDSLKLNRSLSVNSLYNKPGQFPIVHLNKSQIQYKANRNRPASMVRIAPPDKAVFQANTRSSILRTPSIVPTVSLRRTNSELSCENRPILHPVDSGDLVPTKSVLDALREISRKRINSDDIDGNDVIKKYCKETEDISRGIANNNSLSNSFAMKRQREVHLSPNSQVMNSNCERAIKKRMYTRNNDISSSLSSSLHIMTPKRKLGDIQNNHSTSSIAILQASSENSTSPKAKQPCNERNNQQKQLRDKLSSNVVQSPPSCVVNQITASLPATTTTDEHHRQNQNLLKSHQVYLKNPTATVSTACSENASQKPKLTLFNKNYDDEDFRKRLDSRKMLREREEYGDTSGIKFVKPRNPSYTQVEKNPMIEKMKQSRLALMLKGLRGELNENGDEDENDGGNINEDENDVSQKLKTVTQQDISDKSDKTKSNPIDIGFAVTTSASMSFATNTTTSTSTISSPAIAVNPKTSEQDQKEVSTIGNSSGDGFSFGLKTNTVSATTTAAIATSTVSNQVLPLVGTTTTTSLTSNGGFSFGLNTAQKFNTANKEVNISITASTTNSINTVSSNNNTTAGGFAFNGTKSVSNSDKNSSNTNAAFSSPSKPSGENIINSAPQLSQGGFNFVNQQSGIKITQSKSAFAPMSNVSASTDQNIKTPTAPATQNSIFGVPTNSNPGFGNFASNIQPPSVITTTTIASTLSNQASSIIFGSTPPNTFAAFSSSPKNSSSSFSNNSSSSATVTTVPSMFGPNIQGKTTPSFNSPQTSTANSASPFGNVTKSSFNSGFTEASKINNPPVNKPSGGFKFVNVKNSSDEKSTPAPFAFGSTPPSSNSVGGFSFKNPTASTTTTTATPTGATSAQFSFLNTGNQIGSSPFTLSNSSSANQSSSSNVGFNFGTTSKTTDATKPFSFNTSNQTQTTSSSTMPAPVFSFGSNPTNLTENKQTSFAFVNPTTATTTTASTGFSFNNTNPQNTFGSLATNKNSMEGFSFNSPANTENKFSGFGTFSVTSTAQQIQPSQLSSSKFSFSSVSNNKNEVKPSDSSSIFSTPSGNNVQNSPFGGSTLGQAKTFNFGSNTANTNSQNLFGGPSAPTTTASSIFGSVGSQLGKPTTAFTFGGSPSTNQQGSSNASFTFGASSNNTSQMSNPFAPNSTLNKAPTFNFTGQNNNSTNSPTATITPSTHMFPGSAGSNSNIVYDRPIRKATRRLKNS